MAGRNNNRQASTKSTTKLLPMSGQLSSGSSEISDFDRNSPSPTSMLETEEPHHYANPQDLRTSVQVELDKIDGRKKNNLLYESLPISEKQNGYHHSAKKNFTEDNTSYNTSHNDRLYRFLFVVVFLMSFGAFILSILTSFGVFNSCGSCVRESTASTSQSLKQTQSVDHAKLQEMDKNLTHLRDVIIPSLLNQVSVLNSKMYNESLHGKPGPEGPEGPPGPVGPPGAGDLSKCEYRTDSVRVVVTKATPEASTPKYNANPGYIILGASCTTEGGSDHGLFQETRNGQRWYYCKCAGEDAINMSCRIHLWECPI